MDGRSNKSGVKCCFCKKGIEITDVDPCDISIMTNWDNPQGKKRRDQTFWCHLECFRNKMHPDLAQYLVLDILSADNDDEA